MPLIGDVLVSGAGSLTLTNAHSVYVYSGTTAAAWTMPPLAGNTGEILYLVNRGTGVVTVSRAGTDQFYSSGALATSLILSPGGELQIMNDGTYWLVANPSTLLPLFDNTAAGTDHSVGTPWASGVAYTWTHTVGAGNPYGVIAVFSNDHPAAVDGGPAGSGYVTSAVVTFGGVTLTPLGYVTTGGPTTVGYVYLFGAPNIPAGSQTVSVTFTKTSASFGIYGTSYTYFNVAGPGAFTINTDDSTNYLGITQPRTSPNPAILLMGVESAGSQLALNMGNPHLRQHKYNAFSLDYYAGDTPVFGTEPATSVLSISNNPGIWGACALELLAKTPTGPYFNQTSPTGLLAGGTNNTNTFFHIAPTGAYMLVAIRYRKATGTSLGAVTYGGTTMTLLGSVYLNNDTTGATGRLFLYGLANVAGGQKTVSLTYTGGTPADMWAQSVSYYNVTTVGTPTTVYGTGTSLSQTVSCLPNQVIFSVFASLDQKITPTDGSYNLFNGPPAALGAGLTINQATSTNTFTATQPGTPWAGIAVVLS